MLGAPSLLAPKSSENAKPENGTESAGEKDRNCGHGATSDYADRRDVVEAANRLVISNDKPDEGGAEDWRHPVVGDSRREVLCRRSKASCKQAGEPESDVWIGHVHLTLKLSRIAARSRAHGKLSLPCGWRSDAISA